MVQALRLDGWVGWIYPSSSTWQGLDAILLSERVQIVGLEAEDRGPFGQTQPPPFTRLGPHREPEPEVKVATKESDFSESLWMTSIVSDVMMINTIVFVIFIFLQSRNLHKSYFNCVLHCLYKCCHGFRSSSKSFLSSPSNVIIVTSRLPFSIGEYSDEEASCPIAWRKNILLR